MSMSSSSMSMSSSMTCMSSSSSSMSIMSMSNMSMMVHMCMCMSMINMVHMVILWSYPYYSILLYMIHISFYFPFFPLSPPLHPTYPSSSHSDSLQKIITDRIGTESYLARLHDLQSSDGYKASCDHVILTNRDAPLLDVDYAHAYATVVGEIEGVLNAKPQVQGTWREENI